MSAPTDTGVPPDAGADVATGVPGGTDVPAATVSAEAGAGPDAGGPVPFETRIAVEDFLVEEAHLLDSRRFPEWYALFTDDVRYVAPVRTSRRIGHSDVDPDIGHFDETSASLGLRVRKLGTDVAWAEDPPSLTRRFVSNIKVARGGAADELAVRSYLLLYRSRGDRGHYDLLSAERNDVLRVVGPHFRIARRQILLDQVSLGTKNLGIFL